MHSTWDNEANVWTATNDDILGLVLESVFWHSFRACPLCRSEIDSFCIICMVIF
ncbi:MAG: DUF1902 domain-containing protein [Firmicutes bacterium]|nr:DUF1902 domain-containing protein [Bacillota bacterium]